MDIYTKITLLIFLVAVILAIYVKIKSQFKRKYRYDLKRYYLKDSLTTTVEKWMYNIIKDTLPKEYIIAPKVGIKDFVGIKSGKDYLSYFRHISQKHIDFLICREDNLIPVMGIEIDDKSHKQKDRIKRDKEVDQIYNAIGLKVIHIPTRISEEALRNGMNEIFYPKDCTRNSGSNTQQAEIEVDQPIQMKD